MPEMPEGVTEGILRGIYKYKGAGEGQSHGAVVWQRIHLQRSVARPGNLLAEKYGVQANVWSVTSYNELRREALAVDRWNRLHPAEKAKIPTFLLRWTATTGRSSPLPIS